MEQFIEIFVRNKQIALEIKCLPNFEEPKKLNSTLFELLKTKHIYQKKYQKLLPRTIGFTTS